ncbi:hypothetical protein BP6252_12184 [Coleophoma cylindrospora]|uniref:Uncharacterized protein n=1 Tax=Coleophoma cylindrospora TaxID=1849047 RepID=A0A3D8QGF7_9HELO|nr:hypothetical protein BP6252_12184 [Coleophoma cylindrospora]
MDFKRPNVTISRTSSIHSNTSTSTNTSTTRSAASNAAPKASDFKRPNFVCRSASILSTTSSTLSVASTTSSTKKNRPNLIKRSTEKAVRISDLYTDKMRYGGERLLDWCCVGIERLVV